MKFLFDYIPVICFFIAFMLNRQHADAIRVATLVTMIASTVQIALYWLIKRKFEKMHLIAFFLIIVLGGATLLLHDDYIIKMKPTILYWLMAIILLVAQWRGKNALKAMLKDKITLPDHAWSKMSLSWAVFFILLGIANYFAANHFTQNNGAGWVKFKLFGTLGLTLIFAIGQSLWVAKYIQEPDDDNEQENNPS
jgi:intracellular septation protein